MKRIFICLASLLMIFSFSSCKEQKYESKKISLPDNTQVSFTEDNTRYIFTLDYDETGKISVRFSEPEKINGLSFTEAGEYIQVNCGDIETEYPVGSLKDKSPVCRFLKCAGILNRSRPGSFQRQGNKTVYYYFFDNTGFEITTVNDRTVSLKTDNMIFDFL